MAKEPPYFTWCIENQIYQHSKNHQNIYRLIVLCVFLLLIALPLIHVDISVQSPGYIRPTAEKFELKSTVNESIRKVYVNEGCTVLPGDTLFAFDTEAIDAQLAGQKTLRNDIEERMADLHRFSQSPENAHGLRTLSVIQEQQLLLRQEDEIKLRIQNAVLKWQRNKQLFESNVISEEEYENHVQEKDKAIREMNTLVQNRKALCRSEWTDLRDKRTTIDANIRKLEKEKDLYYVRSPLKGTVDQLSGIYKGSVVISNQTIATISPDSTLQVECYVSPKDIGYLYLGMPLQVQVESFNYSQWGMLQGKITEISSDFLFSDNNAYYEVKCHLEGNYLMLKTGQKGFIKKGMSVHTRFMVTKRTLLQLLYQKFDNWVNPALSTENAASSRS